jgi:Glyoxalase-like domain
MIGRIDELVIDCAEPGALAQFWAGVLGGEPVQRSASWCFIDPPGWTRLAFQKVPETKTVKNRLHLDVEVPDIAAATVQAEQLGARRTGGIHHDSAGSFQVLLDPEGNEWCLVNSNLTPRPVADPHRAPATHRECRGPRTSVQGTLDIDSFRPP